MGYGSICYPTRDLPMVMAAVNRHYPSMDPSVYVNLLFNASAFCVRPTSMNGKAQTLEVLRPLLDTATALGASEPTIDRLLEFEHYKDMALSRSEFLCGPKLCEFDKYHTDVSNVFVDSLSPALVKTLAEQHSKAPPSCKNMVLVSFGGHIKRIAPTATAFPWRSTEFMIYAECDYEDPSTLEEDRRSGSVYLKSWADEMMQHSNGGSFLNFIDPLWAGNSSLYLQRYYGDNLEALRRVKHRWVPEEQDGGSIIDFPMALH